MPKREKYRHLAQFARDSGRDPATIKKLIDTGVIKPEWVCRIGGRVKILVESYSDALQAAVRGPEPTEDIPANSRQMRDYFEAKRAELKLKAEAKELLPAAAVEVEVQDAFSRLVSKILNLPRQYAGEWFTASSPRELGRMIDAATRSTMAEFKAEICGLVMEDGDECEALGLGAGLAELSSSTPTSTSPSGPTDTAS